MFMCLCQCTMHWTTCLKKCYFKGWEVTLVWCLIRRFTVKVSKWCKILLMSPRASLVAMDNVVFVLTVWNKVYYFYHWAPYAKRTGSWRVSFCSICCISANKKYSNAWGNCISIYNFHPSDHLRRNITVRQVEYLEESSIRWLHFRSPHEW